MRTTIDIDPQLLAEAMRLTQARTRKAVIQESLVELVRSRRLEELKGMAGTLDLDLDPETLNTLRAGD